jgi:gluconate kinase
MRQALFQKSEISNAMRTDFVQSMIRHIRQLLSKQSKLAVHQTLLKSFMREALAKEFPQATFLLVQSDTKIREERYIERKYFNLGIEYLRHMSALFDPPTGAASRLINSQDGKEEILKQLHTVFSQNANH